MQFEFQALRNPNLATIISTLVGLRYKHRVVKAISHSIYSCPSFLYSDDVDVFLVELHLQ